MKSIFIKCIYQGFSGELKEGKYYNAVQSITYSDSYCIDGIADRFGVLISFPKYSFVTV